MLKIDGVDVRYGDSHIIHGLSLVAEHGEFLGLVGRNGMGKSTLIHTIVRILKPSLGTISWNGVTLNGLTTEQVFNEGVSWVPQGRRVFKSLSVSEHLRIAYRKRGSNTWTPSTVADRMPILRERWDQMAGTLSGGQQQILALGRAVVSNPSLLLVDEPSEGLDQHHRALLLEVLRATHAESTTVVLVEQQVSFIKELCERALIMERGEIVEEVTAERMRGHPEYLLQRLASG